jgi:hypothetical protein
MRQTAILICSVGCCTWLDGQVPAPVKQIKYRKRVSHAGGRAEWPHSFWAEQDRQKCSLRTISQHFFKGRETLWEPNTAFISDEYERVIFPWIFFLQLVLSQLLFKFSTLTDHKVHKSTTIVWILCNEEVERETSEQLTVNIRSYFKNLGLFLGDE